MEIYGTFIRVAGIGTINHEDHGAEDIPFFTKDGVSTIRAHEFPMFLSAKDKLDYFDPNFRKTKRWRSMISNDVVYTCHNDVKIAHIYISLFRCVHS